MLSHSQLATEYQAFAEHALLFDVSHRTQLELTGRDRHSFLHNFCTHDIKALRIGAGCEAFLCNIKGRLLGHVMVFAGDESIWIETFPQQTSGLIAHLQRYLVFEEVKLHDRSRDFGELLIAGAHVEASLESLGELPRLSNWFHRRVPVASLDGQTIAIKRADVLGCPCYWLSMPRESMPQIIERLQSTGLVTGSLETLEALRIEAALPCYGVDLSEENLAQEANRTAQAISFTKGCYLGQEPIARLHAMGHVNKELKRVELIATSDTAREAQPRDSEELRSQSRETSEIEPDNRTLTSSATQNSQHPSVALTLLNPNDAAKEIGRVTSLAWSAQRSNWIGLSIVRSAFSQAGQVLPLAGTTDWQARVL